MKKMKVLQINDAKGYEQNYYSEQLKKLIEDKHISETNYFLTDDNIVVDIEKDIDRKDVNVKNTIKAGAIIKNVFYIEDNNFTEHIQSFNAKGFWNGVEYGEEHGIIFEKESDAKRYGEYIEILEIIDKFLSEINDIEDIFEISFCKRLGTVSAPEFTHYLSNDEDDIREIWESKVNKVYKRGRICPLGVGYLISSNKWRWLETAEKEKCDTICIHSHSPNDKLEELCDYTIGSEEVGGYCDRTIYVFVI